MIPTKLKRKIVINDIEYEYCVTGCTDIFIKNLTTGKTIKRYYDNKEKWKVKITPSDIKKLIQEDMK